MDTLRLRALWLAAVDAPLAPALGLLTGAGLALLGAGTALAAAAWVRFLLAPGHAPDRDTALSIFRHLRAHLAPFKRVRRLEFAELPKTISGKIRRVELRAAERRSRAAEGRGSLEFWEEDFPELR